MVSPMQLTVVGSGDAFGSGGRLQSCYLVDTSDGCVMLDCGATTPLGLVRVGRDPNAIPTIVISHLHGDHFAGLVFFVMQAQYVSKRSAPLAVYGPPGIEARFNAASEALFQGSTGVKRAFELRFTEMRAGVSIETGPLQATAFEMDHPSGAPSHGLRFARDGRTLAFTGDSQWCDNVVAVGRGADLYIMECYRFEKPPRFHMAWCEIAARLDEIGARKVLLTHMSDEMLARRREVQDPRVSCAEDGMVIDV
jgi:ribonuclease BN (tRNA processing enzyme)